jgi:hypothetical protein
VFLQPRDFARANNSSTLKTILLENVTQALEIVWRDQWQAVVNTVMDLWFL